METIQYEPSASQPIFSAALDDNLINHDCKFPGQLLRDESTRLRRAVVDFERLGFETTAIALAQAYLSIRREMQKHCDETGCMCWWSAGELLRHLRDERACARSEAL